MTLWLAIPVMVFSFNHSPIISSFAVAKREEYGQDAERKCSRILGFAHIMMVLTVMFFVFSCVLSLPGKPGGSESTKHLYSLLSGEPL
jgi:serine transporter